MQPRFGAREFARGGTVRGFRPRERVGSGRDAGICRRDGAARRYFAPRERSERLARRLEFARAAGDAFATLLRFGA